ncbi:MAG: ribonuclease P protein component [Acidimicrobiia bacterium]|nr:ribonuclease P protein component [Acidimicrobiia bacterium]
MQSQSYRSLRGRDLFARAYRQGVRRRCGAVTVITLEGETGEPQLGVVAGRKVGSAVARNRAKRRLRAAASRCELKPNTVYVLVAERGVLTAKFPRLVDWIRSGVAQPGATEEKV